MKKNQSGFSAVEGLLILVIIGIISGVGWYIWQANKSPVQSNAESSKQETPKTEEKTSKVDTTIYKVDVELLAPSDVSKLPSYTPASFKSYIASKLSNEADEYGCRVKIVITLISQVNIKGSHETVGATGESDENCIGGAGPIWALTPSGTWDETAGHEHASCTTENGGKVYEEFDSECFDSTDGSNPVKNPNGSITSLNNS